MKPVYILLTLVFLNNLVTAQQTYVPDDNFEQALINLGYDDVLDDYVLTSNISDINTLNVINKNISDLTGIQDFTSLTYLTCNSNNLSSLDLSSNLALIYLFCSGNNLTSLDLTSNLALKNLGCGNNNLSNLNVSYNTELTILSVGYNNLTYLDISTNTNLEELNCYGNNLTNLDLSSNLELTFLNCTENRLQSLDVSSNLKLETLYCSSNNLNSLDVSNNFNLISLDCYQNRLVQLNVKNGNNINFTLFNIGNNPNLSCITVDDADYSSDNWLGKDAASSFSENCENFRTYIPDDNFEQALIDLGYDNVLDDYVLTSNITNINILDISNKEIEDLTGIEVFINLNSLNCSSNNLEYLDVSFNYELTNLDCSLNNIISLNLNYNHHLTDLVCSSNNLKDLDIKNSNNTNFITFNALNNPNLTCIQVDDLDYMDTNWSEYKDNTANFSELCLTYIPDDNFEQALIDLGYDDVLDNFVPKPNILDVESLSISNMDISDLTGIEDFRALRFLSCHHNNLTTLDLSFNRLLKSLRCYDNHLSILDLSSNENIDYLGCWNNNLNTLLINTNGAYHTINCWNNNLSSLDVNGLKKLESLRCNSNNLNTLDLSLNTSLSRLYCHENNINTLNLSKNEALTVVNCSNNNLNYLNLKNENNTSFTGFSALNNSDLECIQVDDVDYMNSNWSSGKNNTASFSENCENLGVIDLIQINFQIFPNPVKNVLNIELNKGLELKQVNIYNIQSQYLYSAKTQTINTENLKSGVYFVEVETNKGKSAQKIVVE